MDELIRKVQQRAGIDESQASAAVNTIIDFLQERLPGPIADEVEGALSGEPDKVESLFGR